MGYGFGTNCPTSKMTHCFGHDGSTGVMAWADFDKKILFVVMNNRGHPDVKNNLVEQFKAKIAN
jgi:CubicO group peptidase (beta-lactamase class C family)